MKGFKDFGGKIIGGILLFLAVKYFSILKKSFRRSDDSEDKNQTLLEIHHSMATIHEKLETYHQEGVTVKPQNAGQPTGAKEQYELGDKFYDAKNYEQAVYCYRKSVE